MKEKCNLENYLGEQHSGGEAVINNWLYALNAQGSVHGKKTNINNFIW